MAASTQNQAWNALLFLYRDVERIKLNAIAQAALGHNSKAIHRAYAKKAQIIVPSLEEYETKAATARQQPAVAA